MHEEPVSAWRRVMSHPAVRVAAWAAGVSLLIFAVLLLTTDAANSRSWWEHMYQGVGRLKPRQVIASALLPLVSLLLTSACFWHLTRVHGRVRFVEMWHLIAASWVLNLLPLKPGLVGRVVYHSKVNQIKATTSIRVLIEASVCGVAGVAMMSALAMLTRYSPVWLESIVVVAWLVMISLGLWGLFRPQKPICRYAAATLLRALDSFTWMLRYAVAFGVLNIDLSMTDAALIAAGAQAAAYVPLIGNGLGIREWVVGALSRWLGEDSASLRVGLAADIFHRLMEFAILLPVGLVSVWWVTRRVRTWNRDQAAGGGESHG